MNEKRLIELMQAFDDALQEWEHNARYKGDYLLEKHNDLKQIEDYRYLFKAEFDLIPKKEK